jgi:hypothetical protein
MPCAALYLVVLCARLMYNRAHRCPPMRCFNSCKPSLTTLPFVSARVQLSCRSIHESGLGEVLSAVVAVSVGAKIAGLKYMTLKVYPIEFRLASSLLFVIIRSKPRFVRRRIRRWSLESRFARIESCVAHASIWRQRGRWFTCVSVVSSEQGANGVAAVKTANGVFILGHDDKSTDEQCMELALRCAAQA